VNASEKDRAGRMSCWNRSPMSPFQQLILPALSFSLAFTPAIAEQPNILLFLVDDMGLMDSSELQRRFPINPGTVHDSFASICDIFPTLLELAAAPTSSRPSS